MSPIEVRLGVLGKGVHLGSMPMLKIGGDPHAKYHHCLYREVLQSQNLKTCLTRRLNAL